MPRGRRSKPAGAVEDEQRPVRDPIGVSLHVGLNTVDPAVYSGWDGRLVACENDARAMELLARRQGFETTTLLSRAATHDAVVGGIEAAADRLWAGDTFLWTLSGHGTQLPDYNGDEAGVKDGDLSDESFCLYDGEIIDDELFSLWRGFRKGVRVVFVADTCHSGGGIRKVPTFSGGLDVESIDAGRTLPIALRLAADRARLEMAGPVRRSRQMPASVRAQVILEHEPELVDYARKFKHVNEAILSSPLTSDLDASVLQIGGCQENETASDGDEYGAFTAALLRVWGDGQFQGDYEAFYNAIRTDMRGEGQTPLLRTWPENDRTIRRQRPLAIWGPSRPARRAAPAVAPTEGEENDVAAPRAKRKRGPAASKVDDATIEAFGAFLAEEGVDLGGVFGPSEFLSLGGSHSAPGAAGFNKNGAPARDLVEERAPDDQAPRPAPATPERADLDQQRLPQPGLQRRGRRRAELGPHALQRLRHHLLRRQAGPGRCGARGDGGPGSLRRRTRALQRLHPRRHPRPQGALGQPHQAGRAAAARQAGRARGRVTKAGRAAPRPPARHTAAPRSPRASVQPVEVASVRAKLRSGLRHPRRR